MSDKIYKYNSNRKTYITTIIYFVLFFAVALLTMYLYEGEYVSAWFISVVVALIALMVISIPRKIVVTDDTLNIMCVLEIVEIPLEEIVSIRKIEEQEYRWIVPLLGSYGFFGYFGYYLDLNTFDRVRFYATEWQNIVEIVDIYDDRYYISCREYEDLIDLIDSE